MLWSWMTASAVYFEKHMSQPQTTIDLSTDLKVFSQTMQFLRHAQSQNNVGTAGMLVQRLRLLAPPIGLAMEDAGVRSAVVPGLVVIARPETQVLAIECISNETQRRLGLPAIGFHRGLN